MSAVDGPVVVVGGGPAGLAAVRAYRKAGGREAVTLIAAEAHPPYERPPLTKDYLRSGEGRDELPLEPASWFAEHDVGLRHVRASSLDPEAGKLTLAGGETVPFAACVLATGCAPQRPPVPGVDLDGVHVLRTLDDADALRARVLAGQRRVVVIGSGFVGCEAAHSLATLGCEVTVVSADEIPQEARLGPEAGRRIVGWLEAAGVVLRLGSSVAEIREGTNGLRVVCGDDSPALETDLVVLGSGARPRLELARSAGLAIDEDAPGVRTDASLRTSHPRVFAVGDIAVADHPLAGRPIRVEHWGEALAQGAVAGRTLAGEAARWETVPGFWSTIGERTLKLVAWGDGWEHDHLVEHQGGGFTVYYEAGGVCVGVLTHEADDDYARAQELVGTGGPVPGP